MTDQASISLTRFLAGLIAQQLSPVSMRDVDTAVRVGAGGAVMQAAMEIADELVAEALRSGLPLTRQRVAVERLGGGNTAEVVAEATLHAPFVFKFDQKTKKLAEEADAIRRIKGNRQLPDQFRAAWPVVYAVRHQKPYAYLMEYFPKEDGWRSLEDRLYENQGGALAEDEALRWINAVLDLLFSGYDASIDRRQTPSVTEDYLKRISERLAATAKVDQQFASRPIRVNDVDVRAWQEYVSILNSHDVNRLAPPFTTVVHGDPNPGNIMLRSNPGGIELKVIDPKEWTTGDYLFDVAKLTHFIDSTGPVEKPLEGIAPRVELTSSGTSETLSYNIEKPTWTERLVGACLERAGSFARVNGDANWEARYELGMAANLLGLPVGRLHHGRHDAALILFGEGLTWLNRFCERQS